MPDGGLTDDEIWKPKARAPARAEGMSDADLWSDVGQSEQPTGFKPVKALQKKPGLFSPEEQAQIDKQDASTADANIAALQNELKINKDPTIRKVLKTELARQKSLTKPAATIPEGSDEGTEDARPMIRKALESLWGGVKTMANAPKAVVGGAEALTEMTTNFFAAIPAIPVGIYSAIKNKNPQAFAEAFAAQQDKLTEHAQTDAGKLMVQGLNELMGLYEKGVDWTIDASTLDKYPAAAALVKGSAMVAPMLLGLRGGRTNAPRGAKPEGPFAGAENVKPIEIETGRVEPKLGDTAKTEVGPTETFPGTRASETPDVGPTVTFPDTKTPKAGDQLPEVQARLDESAQRYAADIEAAHALGNEAATIRALKDAALARGVRDHAVMKEGKAIERRETPRISIEEDVAGGKAEPAIVKSFAPSTLKIPVESADAFVGDLSKYADKMYRETSVDEALGFIPGARVQATDRPMFMSNSPDMALGQGGNKGVVLEFDAAGTNGKLSRAKPAWEPAYRSGVAEFETRGGNPKPSALAAIRVADDLKASGGYKERLKRTLDGLEAAGWTKTKGDGYTEYRRPDRPSPYSGTIEFGAGLEQARANNTFTYESKQSSYGGAIGYPQRKGTPTEKIFSNFADEKMSHERQDQFRSDMLDRAQKHGDISARYNKAATERVPFDGKLEAEVTAGLNGRTIVKIKDGDKTVAAANLERGMIDSMAVAKSHAGRGIGKRMLLWMDRQQIANIHEVPDRSPGFVKIQKQAIAEKALPYSGTIEFGSGPFPTKQSMDALLGKPGEKRELFNPIRDAEQQGVFRWERQAAGLGHDVRTAVPKLAEREAIAKAIVAKNLQSLPEAHREIALKIQDFYREMGEQALEHNKIDGLIEGYQPQLWDLRDPKTKAIIEDWQKQQGKPEIEAGSIVGKLLEKSGSPRSPFVMHRKIANVFEGMELGLKPRSLDAAALVETYAKSMGRTIERAKTMRALRELTSEDGTQMLMRVPEAPSNYVRINSPNLEGFRVHPDIAPAVRVLLQADDAMALGRAAQLISYAAKRLSVSYTFFHPKSLYDAWIGSGGNPIRPKKAIDAALEKYRKGGLGDELDKGVKEGLVINAPIEDVLGRERFLKLYDIAQEKLAKLGLGKPIEIAKKADEKIQKFTWDYVHTGMKIDTYLRLVEGQLAKNLARKQPLPENQIRAQVAKQVNAMFGGINWERMLDAFDRPVARRIMSDVLSRTGRRYMQSIMFAPDWLISTVSSWSNALAPGRANATRRALAARYVALSSFYLFAFGNAVQYAISGHSMFANEPKKKNPDWGDRFKAKTQVELGDGRHLQLNKHFMEVPHLVADPDQFVLNKLAFIPREVGAQMANRDYLSAKATPRYPKSITKPDDTTMVAAGKRIAHAGKGFVPFTAQATDAKSLIGGFFGTPIYGKKKSDIEKEKQQEKEQRYEDRVQRRLDKALGR